MKAKIVPFGMSNASLSRRISEVARDSSKVILMPHAKTRMRQRRILFTQVLQVLQKGRVVENAHQDIHGNWKCTLELVIAGDRVKVASALRGNAPDEMVIVITVMH